jgi:LCP family protein required for cell wall assembly
MDLVEHDGARPQPRRDEPDGPDGVDDLFPPLGGYTAAAPRRSRRRLWLILVAVLVVIVAAIAVTLRLGVDRAVQDFDREVERFGTPFTEVPAAERPAPEPVATGALNVLLLGSDSRVSAGDPTTWKAGAQRTDAIMVVHVPRDRQGAYVISIPRDSWVRIPGRGSAKINAAFSWGGPALMIRTVEQLTKLRIDHVAIVDFTGFQKITDAVGGVSITVPKATKDMRAEFTPGVHLMDGETALNYVRQRYDLPGGDLDRVKRQQVWIRALLKKMRDRGTISNPATLTTTLELLAGSLATDDDFTLEKMQQLATSVSNVGPGDVKFFTAPVAGTGRSPDGQSIVNLSTSRGAPLWEAVRKDDVRSWIVRYKPELLGGTVR